MDIDIKHNVNKHRFEVEVEGQLCVADYRLQGTVMSMTHTGVPTSLEGRGIAARLVEAAFEHARANGLRINPQCAYVEAYMRRHPETQSLRA